MTTETEQGRTVETEVELPFDAPSTLGCGSETGTTLCITRANRAFISRRFTDLSRYECYRDYVATVSVLSETIGGRPVIAAHDLHPDYASTRYAAALPDVTLVPVQHHHAHIAACMVENGLTDKVIGVAFDGMGLGDDGTLWGGEFLVCDLAGFRRAAHFKQYALPGGDQATLNPERVAFSCLFSEFDGDTATALGFLPGLDRERAATMGRMLCRGLRSPLTSSAGRLFDAVSALLGFRGSVSFSGEAAIQLQSLAADGVDEEYGFAFTDDVLDFGPMIREIAADLDNGVGKRRIAAMFHNTLAAAAAEVCGRLATEHGTGKVALSGGVFLNELLTAALTEKLQNRGLEVYTHSLLSPGDACVSLGQAAVAVAGNRSV